MNTSIKRCLAALTICQALAAHTYSAAAQQNATQTDHAARIKTLSEQLHWQNEEGREHYESIKDERSQEFFGELDAYITESFPASVSAQQVKTGLDAVLERKNGDLIQNAAFLADLPSGHFLIAGIELSRGGTAIAEDAISFRAYKSSEGKFAYVASIDFPAGNLDGVDGPGLLDLNAQALPAPPVDGEFWFIAWADVPPLSPSKIVMRLYAFDGKNFRVVWEPANIISSGIDNAVQLTPGGRGFVVNQMPDWQSQTIVHDRYFLTADGPQKVSESTSEHQ